MSHERDRHISARAKANRPVDPSLFDRLADCEQRMFTICQAIDNIYYEVFYIRF